MLYRAPYTPPFEGTAPLAGAEDWVCSTSSLQEVLGDMVNGTVKWFSPKKGYGFITMENGQEVFVHYSAMDGAGFRTLELGERVEFEVAQGPKGLQASNVDGGQSARTEDRSSGEMPLEPEQYEVKSPAGSIEPSRFYIIEPLATETGYSVQVRRAGNEKVIRSFATTFETAAAMQAYHGSAVRKMIELAKYELDQGFIK